MAMLSMSNRQDGFVHLTADPKLLLEVANRFYIDVPGDWMVLVIEASKLTSEVGSRIDVFSTLALPNAAWLC